MFFRGYQRTAFGNHISLDTAVNWCNSLGNEWFCWNECAPCSCHFITRRIASRKHQPVCYVIYRVVFLHDLRLVEDWFTVTLTYQKLWELYVSPSVCENAVVPLALTVAAQLQSIAFQQLWWINTLRWVQFSYLETNCHLHSCRYISVIS